MLQLVILEPRNQHQTSLAQPSQLATMLLLLLLLFSSLCLPTTAIDTLTVGQSLSWNQTLVSKGNNFELGLFSPGKSNKYYIGIWYKKVSKQTVVWVANREQPLHDLSTSRFTLDREGHLVLLTTPSNTVLWSSNTSSPSPGTHVATLQDDGNLVVRSNATAHVTWQSFDHPTNTWLPGARLGYDKNRGITSFLTSWSNAEDPAPGMFSMEIDSGGGSKFDLLAQGAHEYWTTGVWDGEIFANVPEMRSGYFAGIVYGANASVNLFSYADRIPSLIGNFMLDVDGQMRRRQWDEGAGEWILFCSEPRDACDVYGTCGAFGVCSNTTSPPCRCPEGFAPRSEEAWRLGSTVSGCERRSLLECSEDGFLTLSYRVQLPNGSAEMAGAGSGSECELSCLHDCSCTAYAYDRAKCFVWKDELVNLRSMPNDQGDHGVPGVVLVHLRVASSELASASARGDGKKRRKKLVLLIGSGVAAVVLFAVLVMLLLLWRTQGKGKVRAVQGSLLLFDYKAVKRATKNFSEKLGTGSFGTVFKGVLPDATPVAVKRLDGFRQGEKQFRAEVVTLGVIHHVNLVRLRGFCSEGDRKLLVYDYMSNGSLDSYLFKNGSNKVLSWSQRYSIAVGIARGLAYLHEKCRECIIHCDIKPENILLDEELYPKLADFGMAKLVGRDFSRVLTTMRGTLGYLAPEWLAGEPVTAKADVYSFGLLLFELVSGRRNNGVHEDGTPVGVYFPVHAAVKLHEGDVLGLVDEELKKEADVEELERICKVACWCIQDDGVDRPTMGLVVQQLEGVADVGLPTVPLRLQRLAMVNGRADGGALDEIYYINATNKQRKQCKMKIIGQKLQIYNTRVLLYIYISIFAPDGKNRVGPLLLTYG